MQTLTLNIAVLATVAVSMAHKDVRYYLNGACVEWDATGAVTLAATDGHSLTAGHAAGMLATGTGGLAGYVILPRDFVLSVLKAAKREPTVTVELGASVGDCGARALTCTIGAVTLRADSVDGRFPDWRAAARPALDGTGPAPLAAFNPEILRVTTDAALAYAKAAGIKPQRVPVRMIGNGVATTGFALATEDGVRIGGVVMPLRDSAAADAAARATLAALVADPAAPVVAAA